MIDTKPIAMMTLLMYGYKRACVHACMCARVCVHVGTQRKSYLLRGNIKGQGTHINVDVGVDARQHKEETCSRDNHARWFSDPGRYNHSYLAMQSCGDTSEQEAEYGVKCFKNLGFLCVSTMFTEYVYSLVQ